MKKLSVYFSITLCLSILTFCACSSGSVKLEHIGLTGKYYLAESSTQGVFTISIQMELPVGYVEDSIRSFLVTAIFGEKYVQYANTLIPQLYATELEQDYKDCNEPLFSEIEDEEHFYSFNNDHVMEGFSLLNDGKIFSYGFTRYSYMGGAHGLNTGSYYNFDLKTARLITEQDLFVDDYEEALIELFKIRIVEDSETLQTLDDLKKSDYEIDLIKPNGNFYISDEAITYVFNPYEIAPYYMGQTEISIPYTRITHLLKTKSPVDYLVKN